MRYLQLILISVFVILFSACSEKKDKPEFTRLHNTKYQFSVLAPSSWKIIENYHKNIPLLILNEDEESSFNANINIAVSDSISMNVDSYFRTNLILMQQESSDFQIINQTRSTINQLDYIELNYEFNDESQQLKVVSYFFCYQKTGYIITCTATKEDFGRNRQLFNKVVKSFKPNK